jgi:hypothetical protein
VENLFAWVPLLMGAELFGFAMTEAVKRNIVSTIWFFVSSLTAFGIAVFLASPAGIAHLQRIVGVPPLAWFIVATIIVAKILCVIERLRDRKSTDKRSSASITTQTVGVAALLWFALFFTNQALQLNRSSSVMAASSVPTPLPTSVIDYYPLPLTLRTLFDTDFPEFMSEGSEFLLTSAKNGNQTTIPARLFFDFNSNSTFLALFIPSGPFSYAFASAIAGQYPKLLAVLRQRFPWVKTKIPGDTSETSSENMTFSRIYIYHEEDFSLAQLATLEAAYQQSGIMVQFRGRDYQVLHWNERRQLLKTYRPPTPNGSNH